MEWIRVTDRLPEINGGDFFVYYEDEKEFGIARFSERQMDESHWHDSGLSVYPSHWCLPIAPNVHLSNSHKHGVSGKRLIQLQIDLENVTIHLNQICRALEQIQAACASGAAGTVAAGGDEKCTCPDDQCLLGNHPTCRWAEYARKSSEGQP